MTILGYLALGIEDAFDDALLDRVHKRNIGGVTNEHRIISTDVLNIITGSRKSV